MSLVKLRRGAGAEKTLGAFPQRSQVLPMCSQLKCHEWYSVTFFLPRNQWNPTFLIKPFRKSQIGFYFLNVWHTLAENRLSPRQLRAQQPSNIWQLAAVKQLMQEWPAQSSACATHLETISYVTQVHRSSDTRPQQRHLGGLWCKRTEPRCYIIGRHSPHQLGCKLFTLTWEHC